MPQTPQSLTDLLATKKVVVVLGTGGVGKTTISAMLGVGMAEMRRTLVLTVDPARRLKDAISLGGAGSSELRLPDVDIVDVAETVERLFRLLATDEESFQKIAGSRFYQFLDRSLPGITHYLGVFRVLEALDLGEYDLVIVDTPPMGHAVEFLTAAQRILRMGGILSAITGGSTASAPRFGSGLPKLARRTLKFFLGDDFTRELFDFFDTTQQLLVNFNSRAQEGKRLLTSEETALLVVTAPDRGAADDTSKLLQNLPEEFQIQALLLNRVLDTFLEDPDAGIRDYLERMAAMPHSPLWVESVRKDLEMRIGKAVAWYGSHFQLQRSQIEKTAEVCRAHGIPRVYTIPFNQSAQGSPEGLRNLFQSLNPG